MRAFIGTGRLQPKRRRANSQLPALEQPEMVADEIIASGRQRDINNLLERIGNPNHRLTVIYGPSGVGKSSLIYAGLVPILKQRAIGQRDVLPIVIRVYTDWVRDLGKLLLKEQEARGFSLFVKPQSITTILQRLKENYHLNLLTVLIFDQFEELFVAVRDIVERNLLFEFLKTVIGDIPYTQVILSLREEYLHYLLKFERSKKLDTINNILSKNILYYLGNFPIQYSAKFIQKITNKSQFYLEASLSHKLVNDLAGELGEIRPIELQILGYQLQTENITTLDKYQKFGSEKELLTRFFEEVISDCGPENKSVAQKILYVLTDENNTRLLKTKAELVSNLELKTEILDLILRILVSSGLLLLVPEHPADRYQLGHDYFVTFIRTQQGAELLTELEQEREQRKLIEVNRNQIYRRALLSSTVAIISLSVLASFTFFSFLRAKNNEIIALTKSSEVLYSANRKSLAPLIEALRAGRRLKSAIAVGNNTRSQTLAVLQQAVDGVRERNRLEGHNSWLNSISFSLDGQRLATGSADGTVKLWNLETGEEIRTLLGHKGKVNSVIFSRYGKTLNTGSADGTVKRWNLETGEEIRTLLGHKADITSIGFSPDDELIVSGSSDGIVRLLDRQGNPIGQPFPIQNAGITSLSFSPDGKVIVSGSANGIVKLWNIEDKTIGKTFKGHKADITSISFSPDGQTLATASLDGAVRLWNLQGQETQTLQSFGATISSVSFSPDGQTIATGSLDGTVKLWSREGQELQILRGHNNRITSISFSPDGKILATASRDFTVRLWNVEDYNSKTQTLFGHEAAVDSVSFSPDANLIASASFDGTVKLWKRDGRLVRTLEGHQGAVISLSFSPDEKFLASAGRDGTVKLWKLDGTLVKTLEGNQNSVISFSFSPDGKFLASASKDGTIRLWSLDGTLIRIIDAHKGSIYSVSFSPDGKTLATAGRDGTVKFWDVQTGVEIRTLQGYDNTPQGYDNWVDSISFSPEGKTLATADRYGTVKLWDVKTGMEIRTLLGYSDAVTSLSFSPDGTILASGSSYGTVKLWSLADGKLLQTLQSSGAAINSVSFSPDGKTLATASDNKTVMLWNIDLALSSLDELLGRGCDWAGDYLRNNPNVSESDRTLCKDIN
ncbi:MAG: hypothetical protein F6K26_18035 [Moorea sp. SIO2I5]|nr:hypothetical protein [Moorena sp. SIO2I5]